MKYIRMPIEIESPEQLGYDKIRNNLSESSYSDALLKDMKVDLRNLGELALCYGDHAGHPGLRELIAGQSRFLDRGDILLTIGAAGALFIIASSLLDPGDEMIVVRPNYATNIATPLAIGANVKYIDLRFEEGFRLDMEALKRSVNARTKYISVTHPHNPTGACMNDAEMKTLAGIAEQYEIWLLVDETYRDMVFGEKLPVACEYSDRVISVSSLSKTYGLPGIRMGWIACRNAELMETFLAAKEQIHICGSLLDEELAYRWQVRKEGCFERIQKDIMEKFGILKTWMNVQDDLEWIEPGGGCVCFPRMRRPAGIDIDKFYETLLHRYGTYTGPGHWFDSPRQYMRIGYGWPTRDQLIEGLDAITQSIRVSRHTR